MNDDRAARATARDQRIVRDGLEIAGTPANLLVAVRINLTGATRGATVYDLSHLTEAKCGDGKVLTLGARKGPWIERIDGLRCHFEITLRELRGGRSRILSYSFQVDGPSGIESIPPYFRFDYTCDPHPEPGVHPWRHLSPGHDEVRLPAPVLEPLELVDVFLSVNPWWTGAC